MVDNKKALVIAIKLATDGRLHSEPPTLDIKSKSADATDSGPVVLNPPTARMGAK